MLPWLLAAVSLAAVAIAARCLEGELDAPAQTVEIVAHLFTGQQQQRHQPQRMLQGWQIGGQAPELSGDLPLRSAMHQRQLGTEGRTPQTTLEQRRHGRLQGLETQRQQTGATSR
jgi:hypothetical protein